MRLRVSIDGSPAFLDIEGPFTVTPIYVKQDEAAAIRDRIPPVPKEFKHSPLYMGKDTKVVPAPKPKPRFRRVRKTCPVCERGYNAIPRSLYCSDVCRHRAYEAQGGSKKAREWALRIHAGANGVEVQTSDQ